MTLVVLCSTTGAPGATTTALALTSVWRGVHHDRSALLVDADPAGSGLLPAFARAGLPTAGGALATAAERAPRTAEALIAHAVGLADDTGRMVVVGAGTPQQARALAPVWSALPDAARDLDQHGIDVVVDAGRLGHRHEPSPVVDEADTVTVVLRSNLRAVASACAAVAELNRRRGAGLVAAAVVGPADPYTLHEIAGELGIDNVSGIAWDARAAAELELLPAGGQRIERSPLVRSARALAASTLDSLPRSPSEVDS